jgi:hypothetical protein
MMLERLNPRERRDYKIVDHVNQLVDRVLATVADVKAFGAVGDGVTDDAPAFNAAIAAMSTANGGMLSIPPGTYMLKSQVAVPSLSGRTVVWGYGVKLKTEGEITALQISGRASVYGLYVEHYANGDAIGGFDLVKASFTRLYDCVVYTYGTRVGYFAYRIRNEDEADPNTGTFWAQLHNCTCRKRSGADNDLTYGLLILGAANATLVSGCSFGTCGACVYLAPHDGQTYHANGLLIQGCAFEGYDVAISINAVDPGYMSGCRIIGNRFEQGDVVLGLYGGTIQPAVPVFLAGNYLISDAGTYIDNPNNIRYTSLDASVTPDLGTPAQITNPRGFRSRSTNSAYDAFDAVVANVGSGYALRDGNLNLIASWRYRTGGGSILRGENAALHLMRVGSISGSSTAAAKNLRGSATFAGETSKAVTFTNTEDDAAYFIYLGANGNSGQPWVTDKATTGFTINVPAAYTGTIDWLLVR